MALAHFRALILFIQTVPLYKSFTYLLTKCWVGMVATHDCYNEDFVASVL